MAKLHFYYASMNAGKSTALLQADFNYRERGMATMLWTAAVDHRSDATPGLDIVSRIGIGAPAWRYDRDTDLVAAIMPWADRTGDSTALNCLVARFRIRNGIADAEHLLIDTGKITVTGTGQIDLGTEGIDLKLDPRPKDPSLISLATRMRVTGTLAEHSAAPDAIGLATGAATGLMLAIGELNPLALMLPFISIGTGVANPCLAELSGRSQAVVFHGVTPLESLGGLLGSIGHAITQGVGP